MKFRILPGRALLRAAAAFLLLAGFAAAPVRAEEPITPEQRTILQKVSSIDGYITKRMHAAFWAAFPPAVMQDPATRDVLVANFRKSTTAAMVFQQETWASAQLSLDAHAVAKTPKYETAKTAFLGASALPGYEPPVRKSIENADAMLTAAANGTPFQSTDGPIYITPELVAKTRNGLDASAARLHILTAPEWNAPITEYRVPDAHVAVLSDLPYVVSRKTSVTASGKTLRSVHLNLRTGELSKVSIDFTDYGAPYENPERMTALLLRATLKSMNAPQPSEVAVNRWRDHFSAVGAASLELPSVPIYALVRVVELQPYNASLRLSVFSVVSKVDAIVMMAKLEQSLQIIDR